MRTTLCCLALALSACDDLAAPVRATPDRSFVTVASGARLEVLDYGGSGTPLVLLAGLGHTAHVWESFAPRLTDRYRVIALTRRGFGASSQPTTGYDAGTLASDVVRVLDSLHISRAHIVGHSVSGDEITRLARDFASRLHKVVYLDGAYDRSILGALIEANPFPNPPPPSAADIGSVFGFRRYLARIRGVTLPESEVRATWSFGADGSVEGEVTPPSVYGQLLANIEPPDYTAVQVPALAIYAVPQDAADVLPWLTPAANDWQSAQQLISNVYVPFYRNERRRFATAVAGSRVVELAGASHYVFLSDAARVAREVRDFLGLN